MPQKVGKISKNKHLQRLKKLKMTRFKEKVQPDIAG
jgi:hypothetical protein